MSALSLTEKIAKLHWLMNLEDDDCAIAFGVFLHEAPDESIISPHMLLIPNKPEPTIPGRTLFKTIGSF